MVPKEYVGVTFRQLADTLRWKRGRERIVSRRPIDAKNTMHTDSLEAPTLVKFAAEDERVDIPLLLRQGAIAAYTPPKRAAHHDPAEPPPPARVTAEQEGG